jgi:hypothetical protein
MDQSASRLGRAELRALTVALGSPSEDRDILLSWLMRGGEVAIADAGLTGIYNPFADGWLLLRWDHVGGAPHLAEAMIATGTTLRGGTTAPLDQADMPFAQALVARRLQSLAMFEVLDSESLLRLYPAIRAGETDLVLRNARLQAGALAEWSRANAPALRQLDRAISRADDPALLAFPDRVRDALSPTALVSTPDGTELVLASPVYPARSLFARFAASGGEPELFRLDLAPQTGSNVQ